MTKLIAAIAALGILPITAMAQSQVTIYGVADAGLVYESGGAAGSVNKIGSGIASGSRLGFKGKEDLGGGLKAFFVIENGFNIDTGTPAQGGLLFGRQALVGLSGNAGAVTLGRQYSPYYLAVRDIADPFCVGFAGSAANILASHTRLDNTVAYASPGFHGFSANLAAGFGEQPGDSSRNRTLSTSFSYTAGNLSASLAWLQKQNATATDHSRNTLLTARYNWGVAETSLGYARNAGFAGAESHDAIAGVIVPLGGASKLYASYIRHDDTRAANADASQWAVGYTYALSKRTDLYASYAHISNRNGASFKVGNATDDGSGHTGANLGIRHIF